MNSIVIHRKTYFGLGQYESILSHSPNDTVTGDHIKPFPLYIKYVIIVLSEIIAALNTRELPFDNVRKTF
jgi:hypothetical protein